MPKFELNNMYVKYRHVVPMPDVVKLGNDAKTSFYNKHINEILEGKSAILISPVYEEKDTGRKYLQPIFDFDGKKASLIQSINDAKTLKSRIPWDCCFEPTENGTHLVFQIAIEEDPAKLRREFKDLFKSLDVASSFRDMPIFRCGSFRKTYTMEPMEKINKNYMNDLKGKKPIDLHDQVEWISLWERYLFPKRIISSEIFINQVKKLIRRH